MALGPQSTNTQPTKHGEPNPTQPNSMSPSRIAPCILWMRLINIRCLANACINIDTQHKVHTQHSHYIGSRIARRRQWGALKCEWHKQNKHNTETQPIHTYAQTKHSPRRGSSTRWWCEQTSYSLARLWMHDIVFTYKLYMCAYVYRCTFLSAETIIKIAADMNVYV